MNAHQWLELALYLGALILITKPLGLYLGRVFDANGRTWLDPVMRPLERLTYWIFRVDPTKEQGWKQYTFALLIGVIMLDAIYIGLVFGFFLSFCIYAVGCEKL